MSSLPDTARPEAEQPAAAVDWRRLHPRMLVVRPISELVRAVPLLFGVLLAGNSTGRGSLWAFAGAGIAQHCGERCIARTNDSKRCGNGRGEMTARGDADRRAGLAIVRCAGERFEKLVAAETHAASGGEEDADYAHVIRARRGREKSRAIARSSGC